MSQYQPSAPASATTHKHRGASATAGKVRPQRPSSASVYLSSSSVRVGAPSPALASTFAGHRVRTTIDERRAIIHDAHGAPTGGLQEAVIALQSRGFRPQQPSVVDALHCAAPTTYGGVHPPPTNRSAATSGNSVLDDIRRASSMWAATSTSGAAVVPPIPTTKLSRALEHMKRDDYAAAYRCFLSMEPSMLRYVALGPAVAVDTRVAACKYLVNFGVCAATCGLLEKSSDLFQTALQIATQPSSTGGSVGLMAKMAEACRFNHDCVRRMMTRADAGASDETYAGDQRSAADVANEFFLFESDAAVASAPLSKPTHPARDCATTIDIAQPPLYCPSIRKKDVPADNHTGCALRVATSLLSNARCLLQLDPSPLRQTKLCIMVTRANLVEELGMYFSSMSREEMIRPIEMKVKGEGAIDGGYGGVTNDILAQFFSRTMHAFLHAAVAEAPQRRPYAVYDKPSVWRAFGVLLVKSFVEGRSFASLRLLFSVRAWVELLFDGASLLHDPELHNGMHDGSDESDKSGAHVEDDVDDAQAYRWFLKAHEVRRCNDATTNGEDTSFGIDLAAALRLLDQSTGTTYAKGLAFYEDSANRHLRPEFVELLPLWFPSSSTDQLPLLEAAEQQRAVYLWDKVVRSRLEQLLEMQRGVATACSMIGDAVLRDALLMRSGTTDGTTHHLVVSARRLFAAVVCGGPSTAATITAKEIVGRLEFRGWGPEAKAPFLLCSWLHKASADEREGFVALCTGMTALPFEGDSAQAMPRIVVVRSDTHLYAKTCFFTLYLPSWEGVGERDVCSALSAAVASLKHDATMHEVDV